MGPKVTKHPSDTHKRAKQGHKARSARQTKGFQRLSVRWISGTLRGPATTRQTVGNPQPIVCFEYWIALVPAASAYVSNLDVSLVLVVLRILKRLEMTPRCHGLLWPLCEAPRVPRCRTAESTFCVLTVAQNLAISRIMSITESAQKSPASYYRRRQDETQAGVVLDLRARSDRR
jgi:hypothetical protein